MTALAPSASPDAQGTEKLTDWKKEPDLRTLKLDYEMGRQSHGAQMAKIKRWQELLLVTGHAKPTKVKGRSNVQPKLIRRQAEWRYSALSEPFLGSNKLFKIAPVTFEDVKAAEQNELLLNWQFRTKLNRVKFIDDLIRATVDEGTSIVRVGWERTTTKMKVKVPTFDHFNFDAEEQVQAFQEALAARDENPRGFDETATEEMKAAVRYYDESGEGTYAVISGEQEIEVEKILVNRPTAEVLNPQNVILDPTCGGDIDKALFAIISFETNRAELLKEGKKYKNLDKVNWEGSTPATEPDHETNSPDAYQFRDSLRKKVIAYEYWGKYDVNNDGKLVPFVATWIGTTMIRMQLNPFPDGKIPLVLATYLPVKRELYGEPDAELLEDNQRVIGALTRGMVDSFGRSANGQIGFAKGMLDPLNRRRFDNGQDYEFNPNVPVNQGLIQHQFPEMPASVMNFLSQQSNDAEALTGVTAFAGGVSGEAYGDVAAGIRGVLDASSKREMAILRRIAKAVTEIGNKFISMSAIFLSEEEVVRVTNDVFVTVKREDLEGNFDLETDISTAEVDDAQAKDLGFMLQTMGPNMEPKIAMLILAKIAKLKRMPDLAKMLEKWEPTPDPAQEELKKLAIEKEKKEIEKLQSEIDLNAAKAQQARATAEQTDLDYVEQETGTAHAREMDKQRAQSQGNQNLQVTKALTTPRKEGEKKPDVEAAIGFNSVSDNISERGTETPLARTTAQRDVLAEQDPAYSLSSQFYDPSRDPAANLALNL